MKYEQFRSISDALKGAIKGLEAQQEALSPHRQELLKQLKGQVEQIESAQLTAGPPIFAGFYEQDSRVRGHHYGVDRARARV
jgi:hypothetical protein